MYASSVCRNLAVFDMFDRMIHTNVYNKKMVASQYDLEYKTIKSFYNLRRIGNGLKYELYQYNSRQNIKMYMCCKRYLNGYIYSFRCI